MDPIKKEFLIDLVREVQPIWDKGHPDHRNKELLAEHWAVIAANVGHTDTEVKNTWSYLRQEWGKHWRNTSGEVAPDDCCKWRFYDRLGFLTGQFKSRKMKLQNPENSIDEGEDEMSVMSIEKDMVDGKRSNEEEPEDDHLMFLKSLAPQMRKLDPQRNMLFRSEIQGRLYELLYSHPQYEASPISQFQQYPNYNHSETETPNLLLLD